MGELKSDETTRTVKATELEESSSLTDDQELGLGSLIKEQQVDSGAGSSRTSTSGGPNSAASGQLVECSGSSSSSSFQAQQQVPSREQVSSELASEDLERQSTGEDGKQQQQQQNEHSPRSMTQGKDSRNQNQIQNHKRNHHHNQHKEKRQMQQQPCTQTQLANEVHQQPIISADYLAQLIKDRKQLSLWPSVFIHVQRLIDEEINKVRQSLFQLNDVVGLVNNEPLELPEPEGELVQLQEKLYVPVGEHPEYNFVGRLLGPRGMTAKQLEQETGCKIMIRGKGSMRDKKKEEQNRGKANWEHLNDELHVLITVEDTQNRAQIKLGRALEEVKQLLVPIVDGEDELKKRQLMELAIINGTYRECNYDEALSKMLNDTNYRVHQPGTSACQELTTPSPSAHHHHPHSQHPHHLSVASGHHHQPHQQVGGRPFTGSGGQSQQQQHYNINGSSGIPSTGSDTPNSVHAGSHGHHHQRGYSGSGPHAAGLSPSASAAAIAAAAASAAHPHAATAQQQQHHHPHPHHHHHSHHPLHHQHPLHHMQPATNDHQLHHHHLSQQQQHQLHNPHSHHHHQHHQQAAAAAAATASLMGGGASQPPADPSAMIYYHDFHQQYAALAAAAAAASQQQQHQQQQQAPPPPPPPPPAQLLSPADFAAVAAAAAAANQHQHHHHYQQHHAQQVELDSPNANMVHYNHNQHHQMQQQQHQPSEQGEPNLGHQDSDKNNAQAAGDKRVVASSSTATIGKSSPLNQLTAARLHPYKRPATVTPASLPGQATGVRAGDIQPNSQAKKST